MTDLVTPDILHIESCNFIDKPAGGQLNFSRQLMKALGNRLALVGWASAPSDPIGCWFNKEIDGTVYRYFAICGDHQTDKKPLIPKRLATWFQIKKYQKRILSLGIPNILVREHAVIMALKTIPAHNLCFYFPGTEAPLSISRYSWAKRFSGIFDHLFFMALARKANCILAAADDQAIKELKRRASETLRNKAILPFPTRVDTEIFHPADKMEMRRKLSLPENKIIAVTTGRIHWAKGWRFLLDSFRLYVTRFPEAVFIYVGDGAERKQLEQYVIDLGLQEKVIAVGYQNSMKIASYLQASDLFLMGSWKEGWSTVLLEALACQIPIVTTRFSSADTIVQSGINGFVVEREPVEFSTAMEKALNLPDVASYADMVISRYSLGNLSKDLLQVWPLARKTDAEL
ncbi:MAG: glycosyltransferase [Thermodesulfobacteriota bacterium]